MDKRWFWLGGFIVVGILLGTGIIYLVSRPPRGNPIELLPAPSPAPITVYVTGLVNQTGLQTLPLGSRVDDAIRAAGGLRADADTSQLNLAEILSDGQKIDIPGRSTPPAANNKNQAGGATAQLININLATLEELDTLPGIGLSFAQDIIDYRDKNGSFSRIEDIMNVPGIGGGKFEAIKDLITVGTSP